MLPDRVVMDSLLNESEAIRDLIRAGEFEGLDARLEQRARGLEAFFSAATPILAERSPELRAWIESIQRVDAEAVDALTQIRTQSTRDLLSLRRGIQVVDQYRLASDSEP
ncbi:MAG: hypothetical protein ACOZAQ_01540 [Pseudomonadota bacterium]